MRSFEFEFSTNISKQSLKGKIFWITFFTVFIVVLLQHLGIKTPALVTPIPAKADILEIIRPQLQQKKNNYHLKQPTSLIEQSFASENPIETSAYIVVDYNSGNILTEKALNSRLPIASLTKIMTAIIALDLALQTDILKVTSQATYVQPTIMGAQEGETFTLEELLHALLLSSANDAAEIIEYHIDTTYTKGTFVKAMNEKATMINLRNTHFTNPQGFDMGNNYSTVEDLAILTHYALTHYPLIAEIVKKDYYEIPQTSNHKRYTLPNWNGLLGVYPNVLGVKIGNTRAAGTTTIVLAEREGNKILVVLLGAPGIVERDLWTSQLLDLGYGLLKNMYPIGITKLQLQEKYAQWQYLQ